MEKGNGGERKVEKENGGGEKKVEVEDGGGEKKVEVEDGGEKKVEVEDGGEKKPAAPPCFKETGGEDAKFLDTTKDFFKQLQETSADTHWDCIKNRARLAKEYIAEKTSSVSNDRVLPPLPASPCMLGHARVFCLLASVPLLPILCCVRGK